MDHILASWAHTIHGDGQLYSIPGRPYATYTVAVNGTRVRFSLYQKITTASRSVLARFLTHLAAATSGQLSGYTFVTGEMFDKEFRGDLAALALHGRHRIHREFGEDILVHADDDTSSPDRAADFFSRPPTAAEIERAVTENQDYRRVLYTAPDRSLQLVAMNADPLIPREVHDATAQYFLVKHGHGLFEINGQTESVERAAARWVMPGQQHMVASTTRAPLKVFVTYVPAHHPVGRVDPFNVDLLSPSSD
jgi:mannose-6-phosphate isomerase-like protein (cupin superfamily)